MKNKISFFICLLLLFVSWGCNKNGDISRPDKGKGGSNYQPTQQEQAFLDTLEHDTFNYFWNTTNPENGLTPDRFPDTEFSSVAAVGFSLSAYLVGVEKGYINRDTASKRTLTTLKFFWNASQGSQPNDVTGYKGFFYHFLDMQTGKRFKEVELSTIDTSLLLAGILSAQTYFSKSNKQEKRIRALADSVYRRVDWSWAESKTTPPLISMAWHPETGFSQHDWEGYDEGMILYILALGSPTHPIKASAWQKWTSSYQWRAFYGRKYVNFGPLFGYQYSHVWVDFRGIKDDYMHQKGIDYFENSRRASKSNRSYSIDNPKGWKGYDKLNWGLTASDGPGYRDTTYQGHQVTYQGYAARGVSYNYQVDDGTLVPTAAGGSIVFTPKNSIHTLKHFKDAYGDQLYGKYGFKDAFNLSFSQNGWFDDDYLGIDQGPILLMTENYRSNFLWDLMKRNKYIRKGLKRAGFSGGWLNEQ